MKYDICDAKIHEHCTGKWELDKITLMGVLDRIKVAKGNLRETERDDVLKKIKVVKKGSVTKLKRKEVSEPKEL